MSPISQIHRLFAPHTVTEDGTPVWTRWVADEDNATLVNTKSGRVIAYIWHDGYGKYYPHVFVTPWRALEMLRNGLCWIVSLRCFPRFAVEFVRIRAESMSEAIEVFQFDLDHR